MKLIVLLFLLPGLVLAEQLSTYNASEEYDRYEHLQKKEFNKTEEKIYQKWKELTTSSGKVFVNYYNQNNIRLIVDYETGIVRVESLGNSKSELKDILTKAIDDEGRIDSVLSTDLLSKDKISKTELINRLMKKANLEEDELKNTKINLSFNMLSDQMKIRARRFLQMINNSPALS